MITSRRLYLSSKKIKMKKNAIVILIKGIGNIPLIKQTMQHYSESLMKVIYIGVGCYVFWDSGLITKTEEWKIINNKKSEWKIIVDVTLALPVVLSMAVTLIYNMVDTFFVAKTGNPNLVAGVSQGAPIFTLMIALGDIFGLELVHFKSPFNNLLIILR